MADTLLIRLAVAGAGFRDWLLIDEAGGARTPVREGEPEAGVVAGALRIVVIVPGTEVLLSEARVPGRNRQRVLRAIPYALEEQLSSDVESLHFAPGPVQDDDTYPVAVVDRARMDAWAELLAEHHIVANQCLPEMLALPLTEDGWSLMVQGSEVLARSGPYAGFASDRETFPALVALFVSRNEAPAHARLFGDGNLDIDGMYLDAVDPELQSLEVLGRGYVQGPTLDLLQGDYSRREEWGRILRPWKATAALLLAGLLLAGVSTGINYYRLSKQQAQLASEIETVYLETFPKARRIVNPRAQMEQKLKELQRQAGGGGQTAFLALLADVGRILRSKKGVQIQGVTYRDGRLDLQLLADNVQVLDQLKQALVGEGKLRAEIQSATTQKDGKVNSRVRVEGGRA
ncbi:general secretion pathway protein L [Thiogranum longum]|uniref:Type II secretion system protein L n=1 Tax=Thiogranum longum TaxID=1537524 RepID=A0A4R1HQ13_9GAMM|nr:type II secretion system protein GspL [Thiogranum longum]TCK19402.1 general secretion pathway protein L [Thiogranum longum]